MFFLLFCFFVYCIFFLLYCFFYCSVCVVQAAALLPLTKGVLGKEPLVNGIKVTTRSQATPNASPRSQGM